VASTADLALRNFKWRLENTTLAYDRPGDRGDALRWIDEVVTDPESTAGLTRKFNVVWLGQTGPDEESDVSDISERIADHQFEVNVYYATEIPLLTRQAMALQDRHDIYKTLRNMDNRVGYSDAVTTGVVVQTRELDEAEVDRDNPFYWRYTSVWNCTIFETETT
jgi:hypothetical protein